MQMYEPPVTAGIARELRRGLWPLTLLWLLAGCVTTEVRTVDMTPPAQDRTAQPEELLLDVGIAAFDANVPDDYDEQIDRLIQPEIRRAESNYMPYVAKNLLQSTGNWGAVRVVPVPTDAVDVTVTGRILESHGERLRLALKVQDATGREWFEKEYSALASKYAYSDSMPPGTDAFQGVYRDLADDMLHYRQSLTEADLRRIRATAEMRFARGFAPDAFGDHVVTDASGNAQLTRLPAENDPMLERVRRIREREYLFIDTLDEYYAEFYRRMYPSYQGWRAANYVETLAYRDLKAQSNARLLGGTLAIASGIGGIYGSDNAFVDATGLLAIPAGVTLIKTAVNKKNEAAMHAERMREVGTSAEGELMPYTMDLENQTATLHGSVSEQYHQLRRILRKLYYEDMQLPAPPDVDEDTGDGATGSADFDDTLTPDGQGGAR
ncbi:MAG: hypothetical protein H6993_12740 [Pseudomonadales bacterium]|nr:hypothetical protein [Pseudomonadales bacterium]MCP5184825.1 hypothetical protein [Pseudomonadales bacterium]